MLGMVSGLDRKNCWTIAERRGAATPDGLQHLLARASWNAEAVRDDLRDYVIDAFGDPGAILVVDETGDVKKGAATVGVQRQYSGTAGRIENSQVAVYLTYAAPHGHALIDRALYLPRSWADDDDGCAAAGIPHRHRGFATKPTLAATLIDRAVAAQVPAAWVASDEVYGADPRLRAAIRGHGLGYVMAIAANRARAHSCWPDPRRCASSADTDTRLAEALRRRRGARPTPVLMGLVWAAGRRGHRHRSPSFADPPQRCHRRARLPALLQPQARPTAQPGHRRRPALAHRGILPAAKGLVGLDQHQVRRWTTLAMLAHAFLAVATAIERDTLPTPVGLITLTVNEFRRLFDALLLVTHHTEPAGLVTMATTTPIPCPNTVPDNPTTDDTRIIDRDLRLQY